MQHHDSEPQERIAGIPEPLDDEMAAKIRAIRGDDTTPDRDRATQVTPRECALMRYAYEQEGTARAVADEWGVHYHTARRHVNRECSCDERPHIHYDECMRMRNRAWRGAPAETLAMLNEITVSAVYKHISGGCDHDDGVPALNTSRGGDAYTRATSD